MNKIIKISVAMQRIFGFLTPFSIILAMMFLPGVAYQRLPILDKILGFSELPKTPVPIMEGMTISIDFIGFIVFVPLFILQAYWFWQLKNLFGLYAQGKIFMTANGVYARRAAIAFFSITLMSVLINGLLSILLTANNAVSFRLLLIIVGILQICNIFMGILFIVVAWVMDEARDLKEESYFTI